MKFKILFKAATVMHNIFNRRSARYFNDVVTFCIDDS